MSQILHTVESMQAHVAVDLVVPRYHEQIDLEMIRGNADIQKMPTVVLLRNFGIQNPGAMAFILFNLPAIIFLFAKKMKKEVSFVYIRSSLFLPLGIVAALLRVPLFYETHRKPITIVERCCDAIVSRIATSIIVISDHLRTYYLPYGKKILVAHDAVALQRFGRTLEKREAREQLGLAVERKICVYAGSVSILKGINYLIQAAEKLPKIDFLLAGSVSPEFKDSHLPPNVKFLGRKEQKDIPVLLQAADVLLLPHPNGEYSQSPMKLFEYMASGTPIVASRLPSISEVLNDENAVLVEAENAGALASGITLLINDLVLSNRIAEQTLIDVREYTWEARGRKIATFVSQPPSADTSPSLRVVIIAPSMDLKSGWGRYSISVIDALKESEVSPVIITGHCRPGTRFETKGCLLPHTSLVSLMKNAMRVRKISKHADIVHAFDGWPFGFYGYVAVLGTRKKLFVSGIGTYSVAPLNNFFKGFLLRRVYTKARAIFCISNYTKDCIKSKVKKANAVTVFMGLTELPKILSSNLSEYRKRYDIRDQYPILLTVGEVKHRKGQLDTLKAIELLKRQYPNILYIMVGSHSQRYAEHIKKYAKDHDLDGTIRLVDDAMDDMSLSFFYTICDVFALNSNNDGGHFEGFGLVLLEAAQFGKPVIGSRNCGIEDSIWNGYNGYLTNQADAFDISKKIGIILKGNQKELSANSVHFSKKFSWQKTASEYIHYYKHL